MSFLDRFLSQLPDNLRRQFLQLKTPFAIQHYLDSLPYIGEERDRSPLNVMLDRQCHCLDGNFLAALALWQIGFPPRLIDIVPDPGKDDDNVLAVYRVEGRWGAVAKSNYIHLGFREPVYRDLRELEMSYFERAARPRESRGRQFRRKTFNGGLTDEQKPQSDLCAACSKHY